MSTRRSYVRTVVGLVFSASWSILDWVSTAVGLVLPPLVRLAPVLDRFTPADLAWQIPVAVAALLLPTRIFEAVYALHRAVDDERTRLATELLAKPAPKVRIEYRNQLREDERGKPLTLRNISDVVAVDVHVKTMQRGDTRATFPVPIPELSRDTPVEARVILIGTDGSFGLAFADDLVGFLDTTLAERERAGGGLRSFLQGRSIPISVYFYDEDRRRRFRADHRFMWDGPAGLITCSFQRQVEVPMPRSTVTDGDLD